MSVPARDLCMALKEYLELEETSVANLIVSNLRRCLYDPVQTSSRSEDVYEIAHR